jgi:septal ring factor EnvC (AmiA/AmiB activator)
VTAEARWRDLYTGLEELLGTDRADTLMSRISLHPIDELATKAGVGLRFDQVEARFQQVDARFEQVNQRFEQVNQRLEQVDKRFEQVDLRFEQVDRRFDNVDGEIARLHDRIDRLQLTLTAGLFGVIAAIVLQTIFT